MLLYQAIEGECRDRGYTVTVFKPSTTSSATLKSHQKKIRTVFTGNQLKTEGTYIDELFSKKAFNKHTEIAYVHKNNVVHTFIAYTTVYDNPNFVELGVNHLYMWANAKRDCGLPKVLNPAKVKRIGRWGGILYFRRNQKAASNVPYERVLARLTFAYALARLSAVTNLGLKGVCLELMGPTDASSRPAFNLYREFGFQAATPIAEYSVRRNKVVFESIKGKTLIDDRGIEFDACEKSWPMVLLNASGRFITWPRLKKIIGGTAKKQKQPAVYDKLVEKTGRIYCGNKTWTPTTLKNRGYVRVGSRFECFKKGYGAGRYGARGGGDKGKSAAASSSSSSSGRPRRTGRG